MIARRCETCLSDELWSGWFVGGEPVEGAIVQPTLGAEWRTYCNRCGAECPDPTPPRGWRSATAVDVVETL